MHSSKLLSKSFLLKIYSLDCWLSKSLLQGSVVILDPSLLVKTEHSGDADFYDLICWFQNLLLLLMCYIALSVKKTSKFIWKWSLLTWELKTPMSKAWPNWLNWDWFWIIEVIFCDTALDVQAYRWTKPSSEAAENRKWHVMTELSNDKAHFTD